MGKILKKVYVLLVLLFVALIATGCSSLEKNMNNFDGENLFDVNDITTTSEAIDAVTSTILEWQQIKLTVSSQFPIPAMNATGYVDLSTKKLYFQYNFTNPTDKTPNGFVYLENENVYSCTYVDDIDKTYEKFTSNDKDLYGISLDIEQYITTLEENNFDYDKFTFNVENDTLNLITNYTYNNTDYVVTIIYKNGVIGLKLNDYVNIILEEDNLNYLEDFNIDLSLFNN